jgi:pimeloyl-ACP methyl ester carboxylesterase
MGFVTARGVRFHVLDLPCRTAEEAAGEPIVMVHGLFTGSSAAWYRMAVRTLVRRHPVRLIDWRGHGRSSRPLSGYGARSLAEDLAALTSDLPPFGLVTHSYGGIAGLRFLLGRPERVTAAALVEPPLDAAVPGACAEDRARATVAAGDPTVTTDAADGSDPAFSWLTGQLSATAASRLDGLIGGTTIRADLAAEPFLTDAELADLPGIPLLAVCGAESPFRAAAGRLRGVRPDVRAHVLPGGHDVHLTAAEEVGTLLLDFFALSSHQITVCNRVAT